jgi:small-conductance mechanosensitive channel
MVEGIVMDVGWYRTTIRSFEREVWVIPNAVFSKNTVLNVTRKMREWRCAGVGRRRATAAVARRPAERRPVPARARAACA